MSETVRLLLIEDTELDSESVLRKLAKEGVDSVSQRVWAEDSIREALETGNWDIILCDHVLPQLSCNEVIDIWKASPSSEVPLILISGVNEIESVLDVIDRGAADFISKNDLSRLAPAIRRELEKVRIREEKRRAEERLKASNEKLRLTLQSLANVQDQLIAVERFRALGEMASGIAHDFNNALTIILGTVEMLRKETSERGIQLIDQMNKQIDDAASVVRRLKEFYGSAPTEKEVPTNVGEILADVREFTRPKWKSGPEAGEQNISVTIDQPTDLAVWIDPSKLREILTNLVFNACDAIGCSRGHIELSVSEKGEMVDICVDDNGPGMSDEVKARCIEPLYSTKGSDGTGLGLSIVQAVVQSFGGSLHIESELGVGTKMTVRLRRAEVVETNPEIEIRKEIIPEGLRILIVDDEVLIAKLLSSHFRSKGHHSKSLTDPTEVLPLLETMSFDLIVSDRSMPEMSGDELARAVRDKYPSTRFVMASGYGDLMLARGETPYGVDLIVPKPLSGKVLSEALATLYGEPETDKVILTS